METIDTAQARRFLRALTADAVHTFQTFDDSSLKRRDLSRTAPMLHGSLDRLEPRLIELNQRGAGVFVMVNKGDGKGRRAANVTGVRALFLDLDGAPLGPVRGAEIPPSIVVESSPGRYHCYWPCIDMPLERFTPAQKALAAMFGGDPKVHDLPRVLRVPGFRYAKEKEGQRSGGWVCRLLECETATHSWESLAKAFGLPTRYELAASIPAGERNDTLFKLAASAKKKGIAEHLQLEKLRKVNAERCQPPLSDAELTRIVASAYSRAADGFAQVPLAAIDSAAFKALGNGPRTLYLLACRKVDSFNGEVALTPSEHQEWFKDEKTFKRYRRELEKAGLIAWSRVSGRTNLYRIVWGQKHPYRAQRKRGKSTPLEALQVEASRCSDGYPALQNHEGGRRCAA